MTDNRTTELATIIEALTALASAITWTVPNSIPSVESYLKDAWAAIDKLKETTELLPCPFLTAEQVREAVMSADRWKKPMCDTGLTNTHLIIRDDGWQAIADELNATLGSEINGDTSDGYHTFNELYHHRAVLFSVIVRDHRELAWKARKHHDGTMYDGMFIVGIETPKGQATYHYDLDPYWEIFDCEEREFAPEWDGHTPDDAIARIASLNTCAERTCKVISHKTFCGACGCEEAGELWTLSCGHEVMNDSDFPPNFCDECGCKVVEQ